MQVEQSTSINGSQKFQQVRYLRSSEIYESAYRRFSVARSNQYLNAEGNGIQQQIRGEAKEIQDELTDTIWTCGLVIWLRWWKKLILGVLRRGRRIPMRGFLAMGNRERAG